MLKPLTARSVVASTLLGMNPPRLSSAALVASGEQFGVAPGTTRVALSRMVDAGELSISADGVYALAGPLVERHARQEQGRHPRISKWTGDWRVAVIVSPSRSAADRAALRTATAQLRMAELREGVWLRPDNISLDGSSARRVVDEQCMWMRAQLDEDADIDALFGVTGWAAAAQDLLAELARTAGALTRRDAAMLGETFVIAAATTRHLTLDPLLPEALLPRDWPGEELRARYDAYQADFAATWRAWFRSESNR